MQDEGIWTPHLESNTLQGEEDTTADNMASPSKHIPYTFRLVPPLNINIPFRLPSKNNP